MLTIEVWKGKVRKLHILRHISGLTIKHNPSPGVLGISPLLLS